MQRDESLRTTIKDTNIGGSFTKFTKSFRFLLQSVMMAAGAYLVLQQQLSPGAMIAGSILMGRVLVPIEQSIGQWPMAQQAQAAWGSLAGLLATVPVEEERTSLPKPKARLQVQSVSVAPPGENLPTLKSVSFGLEPGQALGVIGQSASGKSTPVRVLTGIWKPQVGKVRLDGAALDQYQLDVLGQHIGYLLQDVLLFDASIVDNIARLSQEPNAEMVVAAAKKAGAHEMILHLPDGYDTRVCSGGSRLSGGQKQRLSLARALYGEPVLLVLEEPNANLDAPGSQALYHAIEQMKADGKSVIIMVHRPSGIATCDMLLVLENGACRPRDEVLKETIKTTKTLCPASKKHVDSKAIDRQDPSMSPQAAVRASAGTVIALGQLRAGRWAS